MIALASFLARLLPGMASWIVLNLSAWHVAAFAGLAALVVVFLEQILVVLAWAGGLLLEFAVRVFAVIVVYLLNQLPGVPTDVPGVAWETLIGVLGFANRYAPVDLAFDYLGILLTVYTSVVVWKLVKFVRGGG